MVPTPTTSPVPVSTPSASPTPTTSPPPPTSPPPAATGIARCPSAQLRLTVRDADSGAGQFHQQVILTNRGSTCTLYGYPGASFLDGQGRLLGSPADQSPGLVRRLVLHADEAVSAVLSVSNAGAYPDSRCRPQQAARLRIYPPGDRLPLLTADPLLVCSVPGSGQLHISPLQPTG